MGWIKISEFTQSSFSTSTKLTVWSGYSVVFMPDNFEIEAYMELLQEAIDPAITNVIENYNNNEQ